MADAVAIGCRVLRAVRVVYAVVVAQLEPPSAQIRRTDEQVYTHKRVSMQVCTHLFTCACACTCASTSASLYPSMYTYSFYTNTYTCVDICREMHTYVLRRTYAHASYMRRWCETFAFCALAARGSCHAGCFGFVGDTLWFSPIRSHFLARIVLFSSASVGVAAGAAHAPPRRSPPRLMAADARTHACTAHVMSDHLKRMGWRSDQILLSLADGGVFDSPPSRTPIFEAWGEEHDA